MDFDTLAGKMIGLAERPLAERLKFLSTYCPAILRQIKSDRGRTGPFPFWGRSVNVDELAGETIVPTSILETLAAAANVKMSLVTPNAGLQHTYGYLFSTIQTAFGKKRDRWIDNSLEQALGQAPETLGVEPPQGTLLSNVTWLAGQIAFRDDDRLLRMEIVLRRKVSESLHAIPWKQLRTLRLVESVELRSSAKTVARIDLVTDAVRVAPALNLLVYSVRDSRKPHPELITLFTVRDDFLAALRERAAQGQRTDIRPRYNAYVERFPQEPQVGTCRLI